MKIVERIQLQHVSDDLEKKMVFLSGPRQVGKTTLAKTIAQRFKQTTYLNYDEEVDRKIIRKKTWDRESELIIFDEVHKLKKWKTHLKGTYDKEGIPPRILVTGSARLDIYRRGGDSLAGRYFLHRLYPFSVRELRGTAPLQEILENLIRFGGYPEPFLSQSEKKTARWRKQHIERILRIDVQDLEPVRDIQTLIVLIDLLRERVGNPVSYSSLARDLEISPHTVKRWIQILAHMYIIFIVTPYHRNLGRALLKEPKIYFYDNSSVIGDDGARFENHVALSLLKHLHYLEDVEGAETRLCYVRDKEKREVDFLVVKDRHLDLLIEAKWADASASSHLRYYSQRLQPKKTVQLVMKLKQNLTDRGIQISMAADWLNNLSA